LAWTRAQHQSNHPTHTHKHTQAHTVRGRGSGRQILSNTHLISANVRHLQSYARHSIGEQESAWNC